MFRELVHQVLEKIKNESYFKWPNKMERDLMRHNQSLYYQYHQEQGHTTEDYRTLWNHLEQLVRMEGYNSFCIDPISRKTMQGQGLRGILLQGPLWAQLMSSLLLLGELVLIPPM